ncbi:hypothetical protein Aam_046_043 [Acidocella aminolytica 101 = DSM 11237]|uniref:Uncharacterized protein n=2 Tax=Acidocella TaxID=50709 RepID=A0A0D6PFF8_9PROT|nr:hypothetical protein Aam_046_043 [Acidocella aminolytica 101 = DSM 11237]GBQ34868.1 hypothetical protein AA11237_0847 [Acidocella aminolytica 101 = DSM 11237]
MDSQAGASPKRAIEVDIKALASDVIRLAGVKMRVTDPLVEMVVLNEKILETMVRRIADIAASSASQAAHREVVLLLQQHDATFGERANELSEMIEENILAASKDGVALLSGAVQGSAQAVGQRTLDQIAQFSRVVRRVEYIVYGTWAGLAVLVAGIAIGRFV